jgi:IS30 family transposase
MDIESTVGTVRRRLSDAERKEILRRVKAGDRYRDIALDVRCSRKTIQRLVNHSTPVLPAWVFTSESRLTFDERDEIANGLRNRESLRAIAARLGRAPSTISREVRLGSDRRGYRASLATKRAAKRSRRPKQRKLLANPRLLKAVNDRLRLRWSPEQVAASLKRAYPQDEGMRVSAETIYQTLYLQARGSLRGEVKRWLRSGRAARRPRGRFAKAGRIKDMILISERPAEVADRAVPGHWEGDLVLGARGASAIGTLVERKSRFVLLFELPKGRTAEEVTTALVRKIRALPIEVRRSLTWDRGKELAEHKAFTIATGVQVYFCDPYAPWQRGSNENTNGLLRQYLPKTIDLSTVDQETLDEIAAQLNTRPRKTLDWNTPADVLAASVAGIP